MVVLFDRASSFGRDAHGAVREEGDTRLASQISQINPGDQWGDRCHNQIALTSRRRESKSKGEKERYSHLNAEFQRLARKDKKAFLSDQCKEIEENNRMGKTRDLFKKIRDTKGTFHAKVGSIKGRNGMDLTEAEDIKKRWQKYPEKIFTTQIIMMV